MCSHIGMYTLEHKAVEGEEMKLSRFHRPLENKLFVLCRLWIQELPYLWFQRKA